MRSLQDHMRFAWSRDQDLHRWVPATEGADNRFFDEGLDPSGTSYPKAIVTDTGASGQSNLGDHVIFEPRPFSVRLYANSRKEVLDLARRFRLVFANVRGDVTEDGTICMTKVTGGSMARLADGIRMIHYTLTLYVTENRGPARLRATTEIPEN